MEEIRSTDAGREKHREQDKKLKADLRSTDAGREKYNDYQQEKMEQLKEKKITDLTDKMATLSFPPDITEKIEKECIENYIAETSQKTLTTIECGICGEGVRDDPKYYEQKASDEIPHSELLSTEHSTDNNSHYEHFDLILSPGGVDNEKKLLIAAKSA